MNKAEPIVLYISMAHHFGGGEVQTERLIYALNGFKAVFYGRKNSPLAQRLKQNHIPILPNLAAVFKLLMQKEPVIIHACDGRSVHLAALLKRISGKPLLITRHVVFPLKRKLSLWSYRQADSVVGVSQQASGNLKAAGIQASTIYGSVDKPAQNDDINTYFVQSKHRLKIGQIGNFQAVKNFPLTIELAKRCPEADFYLIGSGELEAELKQRAAGLDNLFFIPFTPYVGSIFKNLDLQILPSHSEGLATVILEGYQYAVPVLAHATGGIPEIVKNGQTGYLIHQNQPENYLNIIRQLQNQPSLLAKLSESTRQYWQQQDFSAIRMASEYQDIYRKILKLE